MKNAILQRFQGMIWFLSLERFAVVFAGYMFLGTLAFAMRGAGISGAFLTTLFTGVILTAAVSASRPLRRLEQQSPDGKPLAWHLLFGSIRRPKNNGSGDPKVGMGTGGEQPSGVENEEFRKRMRANQLDSVKRGARKMHDKVIHTSFAVVIFMAVFWFGADSISGFFTQLFGSGASSATVAGFGGAQGEISFEAPRDLFMLDWKVLAGMWFLFIVLFPRWLVYLLLMGMAGMRIVFLVFGPMASIWLMNMGQLPFFYGLMMVFMFGSMIYPFIRQAKFYRPGDATWETPRGSMRGQPEVRALMETELAKLQDFIAGKSKRRPTRGAIFEGPPGTGKTLYAKEIATEHTLPFVMMDGAAFSGAPLINLIIEYYIKPRTHGLAAEYGGVVFFVDEAEVLFGARQGMMGGGPMGGMEVQGHHCEEIRDVWDLLSYDSIGVTSKCGLLYDLSQTRERFWRLKSSISLGKAEKTYTHPFFMPMGMGGGGQAIFPFLTWLDGVGSPPAMATFKRGIVNDILDGLFIPPNIPGTQIILRLPPAKPINYTILFIIATNRAFMLDPAIRRPGRMGVSARFKTPDLSARKDIIDLYFKKGFKEGLLRSELLLDLAINEFARATSGMSPAEIEAAISTSYDVRGTHVKNMKRIKALIDSGVPLDKLLEQDRKYWLRNEDELKDENWDDDRAGMRMLLEARNTIIYGRADPGLTTTEHREQTAIHEYWGHFLLLKGALGDVMEPSVLSVMPRGLFLGMVSHIRIEERDPTPQRFYEGLIRVSLGSTVAERFFFCENQPGVSSDLENATRVACYMVGKAGMGPYKCSPKDLKKFAKIGERLIAVPSDSSAFLNPFAKGFVEQVLSNPSSRERVAVILGQADVDDYRFTRVNVMKNYEFHEGVIKELLRLDELGGVKLEAIWNKLDDILITWDKFDEEQLSWWPDNNAEVPSYFYNPTRRPEVEEALEEALKKGGLKP